MVETYSALSDRDIEGNIIESGYDTIVNRLKSRFENVNRKKKSLDENTTNQHRNIPSKVDAYGCLRFYPAENVTEEELKKQAVKKQEIKTLYNSNLLENNNIHAFILETYDLQRNAIICSEKNNSTGISLLMEEWPLLFTYEGIKSHFSYLTAIDINSQLGKVVSKMQAVLNYMKFKSGKKFYPVLKSLEKKQ